MWLILSEHDDPSAEWLVTELKKRGFSDFTWVNEKQLAQARLWRHRVNNIENSIYIVLQDGRTIDSSKVTGVINRLQQISPLHSLTILGAERLYAFQEISALYLSWLNAFNGPILNPASPSGLSGELLHVTQWALLAHVAGLKVPPVRLSSSIQWYNCWSPVAGMPHNATEMPSRMLYVVSDKVVIPSADSWYVPDTIQQSCLQLAKKVSLPLLGIDFISPDNDNWFFYKANPIPSLIAGGDALMDAFAAIMYTQD